MSLRWAGAILVTAGVQHSWRTGAFHGLVQFIVTSHPSKVASLLVGGFPGETSELLKGHRSFKIFSVTVHREPRSLLLSIFRHEASASHRNKNVGTLNFYPQVRVDHISLRAPTLRPLFAVGLTEEFLAQSRPLHGGRLIFHIGFGGIHNPFLDREMWADWLQLIARRVTETGQRGESRASRTRGWGRWSRRENQRRKGSPVTGEEGIPGTSRVPETFLRHAFFLKKGHNAPIIPYVPCPKLKTHHPLPRHLLCKSLQTAARLAGLCFAVDPNPEAIPL